MQNDTNSGSEEPLVFLILEDNQFTFDEQPFLAIDSNNLEIKLASV